ncbi:uncharacterized protein B0T15DRAFT_388345 [Chaetomium strumarium]|uniref:Sm domain-containing protein n=1 Tax=Chaetomium strumarium TaxID=1170767 RepID=A0AAJ0H3M7_9PEZI|nr:hypothetical protein B0T15DRAFT_388345 [Chaetomium strumarium]
MYGNGLRISHKSCLPSASGDGHTPSVGQRDPLPSPCLVLGSQKKLTRKHSFFKTLIDHEVTVELKNDIQIRGVLKSVDQYLNIKLDNIQVLEELKYPHLSAVKNVFIRGSVVRYVHLPASAVDVPLLEDATRRGELLLRI